VELLKQNVDIAFSPFVHPTNQYFKSEMTIANILRQYLSASTVHGLPYVANSRQHPLAVRIIWALVVAAGFFFTCLVFGKTMQIWAKNPTITVVTAIDR